MRPVFLLFFAAVILSMQCGSDKKQKDADIPDSQIILDNIDYLDSVLNSQKTDSIILMDHQLETALEGYRDKIQNADDKAVFDSLGRIKNSSAAFIRFCIDSRVNLESLRQDINSVVEQYRSGKLTTGLYINALIESEQVQADIYNRYVSTGREVLTSLKSYPILEQRMSSIKPVDETGL